jgi:MOSC domain-containing protein
MRVARINVTPVKGLGLQHPDEVQLTEHGVETNRRFYLISGWRLFNGKDYGPLVRIAPEVENGRLTLRFPDGRELGGEVELGEALRTNFWGRPVDGRLVVGPWAKALSDYAGESVQLVRTEEPGTGSDVHVGTLVSRGSGERLAEELGAQVDLRRFRMLLELDGVGAHEEDGWERVRIGEAIMRIAGPVPRCAVTTQDPSSGVPTLDTLRGIKAYRGLRDGKIDFGVYFDVEQPGRVRVGDALQPL